MAWGRVRVASCAVAMNRAGRTSSADRWAASTAENDTCQADEARNPLSEFVTSQSMAHGSRGAAPAAGALRQAVTSASTKTNRGSESRKALSFIIGAPWRPGGHHLTLAQAARGVPRSGPECLADFRGQAQVRRITHVLA